MTAVCLNGRVSWGRAVVDVGATDVPGCRESPWRRRAVRAWRRPAPP
jgi:hypothetical protein